ncbi:MAG: 4Fe-4S binding protein [Balneolaceae bacterium]|nr:4Fe-4S binding protein [Balneolaceae bacterium]
MKDQDLNRTIDEITDSNPGHTTASAIKYIGLGLFFVGLLVFLGSLMMNDYKLTNQVLQKSIVGDEQQSQSSAQGGSGGGASRAGKSKKMIQLSAIEAEVQPMLGKTYTSQFAFISDLRTALATADETLTNENKMYSYQQGQYLMYITKAAGTGFLSDNLWLLFWLSIGLGCFGALMYFLPKLWLTLPGIQNDHIYHNPATKGKTIGIIMGSLLIGFYVVLYWYPEYIANWIAMVDPISYAIKGEEASQWFLYGLLYTLAIVVMGVRMFIKYRHSTYHMIRTGSVMFFQTAFAFLIPEILVALNKPYFDFKNIWPLHYDFFYDYSLNNLAGSGSLGLFMLVWGIALIIIGVPVFTYFYGKRWYCSWVCGCGGLAETMGDPHRQLSDKSLNAWKIERWMVHSVLVLVVIMTAGVLYTYWTGSSNVLGVSTYTVRSWYGFAIGSVFAGVIGVGFYPFMGNRVWCRFGCPLAAYLGLVQRFKSRFRITTNGGQCISCGNCSTYCEMGIDVRWYAQRGQNIVRSSCVGCGVCASVCPRGVLKLENGPEEGRFNEPKAFTITDDGIEMNKEMAA